MNTQSSERLIYYSHHRRPFRWTEDQEQFKNRKIWRSNIKHTGSSVELLDYCWWLIYSMTFAISSCVYVLRSIMLIIIFGWANGIRAGKIKNYGLAVTEKTKTEANQLQLIIWCHLLTSVDARSFTVSGFSSRIPMQQEARETAGFRFLCLPG